VEELVEGRRPHAPTVPRTRGAEKRDDLSILARKTY
jgi:hypothetical protein